MLWLVCFLSYADRQVIFVVFPLLSRQFHLNNGQLGVLSASFMVVYAITGPLAGRICDHVSRRRLVLGALIVWSLCTTLSSWVHNYWQLVAAVAVTGFCEAFYFPAAMSLLSDYHAPETRSLAMAAHQSAVYVGSIAGGVAAGFLGQHFGWRAGFRGFGLLGVVTAILLFFYLHEPKRGMSDHSMVAPVAAATRPQMTPRGRGVTAMLVLVFIGANFVAMAFTVWMPTYIYRSFRMNLTSAGWSGTAYMQIASIAGVFCGGVAADWLVRRRAPNNGGARMLVQAVGLACAVPFLFATGWVRIAALAFSAVAGFGLFKGVYESNIWASLYDVTPIERRGTAVGVMNSLGWLGAAAAQLIIGVASERLGLGPCLSATSLIYLLIALLMFVAARSARSSGAPR